MQENQAQGPYRASANPHKEAYQREERMQRILERAPARIKGLSYHIRCLSQRLDSYADSYWRVVGERNELSRKVANAENEIKSGNWWFSGMTLMLVVAVAALVHAICGHVDLSNENSVLRAEIAQLGTENHELRSAARQRSDRALQQSERLRRNEQNNSFQLNALRRDRDYCVQDASARIRRLSATVSRLEQGMCPIPPGQLSLEPGQCNLDGIRVPLVNVRSAD